MRLPTRIHLLRHGESIGNVRREVYATMPDWSVPLTDRGREQARIAGAALREDLERTEQAWLKEGYAKALRPASLGVYLSPYVRVQQTWEEMALALSPIYPSFVREDVRLREQEWSANPAASVSNNKAATWEEAKVYGPFWYRHPSGESMADALHRAYGFWERFRRDCHRACPHGRPSWSNMPDDVLIITHGIQLRLLLMAELDWTVEQFYRVDTPPNCARYTLALRPDGLHYDLKTPLPERQVSEVSAL